MPLKCYGGVAVPGWSPGPCSELPYADTPNGNLKESFVGTNTAVGYACQRTAPNATLLVAFYIDGKEVGRVNATVPRPDLPPAGVCVTANHGFNWEAPVATLKPGSHHFEASTFAADDPEGQGVRWPIGQFTFSVKEKGGTA